MFILGLFRSTSLYCLIIYILGYIIKGEGNDVALTVGCIYPIVVLIHQICLKISRKSDYSFFERYFSSLFSDIAAPFRHIFMFVLVITGIHKIQDDSSFHNTCDLIEVIAGFALSVFIIIIAFIVFI